MMQPWQIIALLGAVILLYAYLLPKPKKTSDRPVTTAKEVEEALEIFAQELETENRKLIDAVADMRKQSDEKLRRFDERLDEMDKQHREMKQAITDALTHAQERATAPAVREAEAGNGSGTVLAAPIAIRSRRDRREPAEKVTALPNASKQIKERYEELFRLHEQGNSIEAIAKKLGMNKGEVQLIIQLARQEDQFRAR